MKFIATILITLISFSAYASKDGCTHKGKLYKNKEILKFNNIRNECVMLEGFRKEIDHVWINADSKNRPLEILKAKANSSSKTGGW